MKQTNYVEFMEWLQRHHVELYICCWQNIKPSEAGRIDLNKEGLSEKYHKALAAAIEEFKIHAH